MYAVRVSRRRLRRPSTKEQRHAAAVGRASALARVVREAPRVERLAYTRTQAAAVLGVSRSTFDRRVLPLIETIEMPWGTQLIPVDSSSAWSPNTVVHLASRQRLTRLEGVEQLSRRRSLSESEPNTPPDAA